jgi:hypothetical protein
MQKSKRGADLSTLRQFNRRLILAYIRDHPDAAARAAIATALGLSRATVSAIVGELAKEGIIEEDGTFDPSPKGGRRATRIRPTGNVAEEGRVFASDALGSLLDSLRQASDGRVVVLDKCGNKVFEAEAKDLLL